MLSDTHRLMVGPCGSNSVCMLPKLNSLNMSVEVKWAKDFNMAVQTQTPLLDPFTIFNLKIQTGGM